LTQKGRFTEELITARKAGNYVIVSPGEINLIDVSPAQLVSVAAGLIPFLEHDDANRALMGSNMQRQAVPLLKPQAPLVGTGIGAVIARDSGAVIVAKESGIVEDVDATRIVIKRDAESGNESDIGVDIYNLTKISAFKPEYLFQSQTHRRQGKQGTKGRHYSGRSGYR